MSHRLASLVLALMPLVAVAQGPAITSGLPATDRYVEVSDRYSYGHGSYAVQVALPVRGARWLAPPAHARRIYYRSFAPEVRWKLHPRHRVAYTFYRDEIWFLDPTSSWPFTIDRWGVVYTVDPYTGFVYSLGTVDRWTGPYLYFFSHFDFDGRYWHCNDYSYFRDYWYDRSYGYYDYGRAYDRVWGFSVWFGSSSFVSYVNTYSPRWVTRVRYYRDVVHENPAILRGAVRYYGPDVLHGRPPAYLSPRVVNTNSYWEARDLAAASAPVPQFSASYAVTPNRIASDTPAPFAGVGSLRPRTSSGYVNPAQANPVEVYTAEGNSLRAVTRLEVPANSSTAEFNPGVFGVQPGRGTSQPATNAGSPGVFGVQPGRGATQPSAGASNPDVFGVQPGSGSDAGTSAPTGSYSGRGRTSGGQSSPETSANPGVFGVQPGGSYRGLEQTAPSPAVRGDDPWQRVDASRSRSSREGTVDGGIPLDGFRSTGRGSSRGAVVESAPPSYGERVQPNPRLMEPAFEAPTERVPSTDFLRGDSSRSSGGWRDVPSGRGAPRVESYEPRSAPRFEAPRSEYRAPRTDASPSFERYQAPQQQSPRFEAPQYRAPHAEPAPSFERFEAPQRQSPRFESAPMPSFDRGQSDGGGAQGRGSNRGPSRSSDELRRIDER